MLACKAWLCLLRQSSTSSKQLMIIPFAWLRCKCMHPHASAIERLHAVQRDNECHHQICSIIEQCHNVISLNKPKTLDTPMANFKATYAVLGFKAFHISRQYRPPVLPCCLQVYISAKACMNGTAAMTELHSRRSTWPGKTATGQPSTHHPSPSLFTCLALPAHPLSLPPCLSSTLTPEMV